MHLAQMVNGEYLNHWFNTRVAQYPNDLIQYQEIISEVQPDWIIETGTLEGGLTLFLSNVLQGIHPEGKIITVDIDPVGWNKTSEEAAQSPGKKKLLERIEFIQGSSTAPEVIQKIKTRITEGSKVLVLLDSLHSKDHVMEEMKLYGPLVSKGSYLIVSDTHLDHFFGAPGPLEAVRAFLKTNSDFTQDRSRERYLISANFSGWLKKK